MLRIWDFGVHMRRHWNFDKSFRGPHLQMDQLNRLSGQDGVGYGVRCIG